MLLPQGRAFEALKNRLECAELLKDVKVDGNQPTVSQKSAEQAKRVETMVKIFVHQNGDIFGDDTEDLLKEFL